MGERATSRLWTGKTFLLTFLAAFVFGVILFPRSLSEPREPIAFNHRKHVDAGMDCADCHTGVREQARALLPDISLCLTCHESEMTPSAEEAKIRQAAARGEPLVWQQAARMPRHVYFSHRRHVALGRLECAVCHGNVRESTAPSNLPAFRLSMARCMDCHGRQQVRNDCNDCHR